MSVFQLYTGFFGELPGFVPGIQVGGRAAVATRGGAIGQGRRCHAPALGRKQTPRANAGAPLVYG